MRSVPTITLLVPSHELLSSAFLSQRVEMLRHTARTTSYSGCMPFHAEQRKLLAPLVDWLGPNGPSKQERRLASKSEEVPVGTTLRFHCLTISIVVHELSPLLSVCFSNKNITMWHIPKGRHKAETLLAEKRVSHRLVCRCRIGAHRDIKPTLLCCPGEQRIFCFDPQTFHLYEEAY